MELWINSVRTKRAKYVIANPEAAIRKNEVQVVITPLFAFKSFLCVRASVFPLYKSFSFVFRESILFNLNIKSQFEIEEFPPYIFHTCELRWRA